MSENLGKIWDEFHKTSKCNSDIIDFSFDLIKEKSLVNDKSVILDFGCGDGELLKKLNSITPNLYGCDISSVAVNELAKDNRFVIKQNEQNKIPFDDNMFDLVSCVKVLHAIDNLDDLYAIADEMKRVTKPTGKIYIVAFWHQNRKGYTFVKRNGVKHFYRKLSSFPYPLLRPTDKLIKTLFSKNIEYEKSIELPTKYGETQFGKIMIVSPKQITRHYISAPKIKDYNKGNGKGDFAL